MFLAMLLVKRSAIGLLSLLVEPDQRFLLNPTTALGYKEEKRKGLMIVKGARALTKYPENYPLRSRPAVALLQ